MSQVSWFLAFVAICFLLDTATAIVSLLRAFLVSEGGYFKHWVNIVCNLGMAFAAFMFMVLER